MHASFTTHKTNIMALSGQLNSNLNVYHGPQEINITKFKSVLRKFKLLPPNKLLCQTEMIVVISCPFQSKQISKEPNIPPNFVVQAWLLLSLAIFLSFFFQSLTKTIFIFTSKIFSQKFSPPNSYELIFINCSYIISIVINTHFISTNFKFTLGKT